MYIILYYIIIVLWINDYVFCYLSGCNVESYFFVCPNCVLDYSFANFKIMCIDDDLPNSYSNILNYFTKYLGFQIP